VVNRQASTLTVSGTQKQHEMIQRFLDKIEKNTSSQVLIEAKIVEVNLSDQYQSGIDWSNFGGTSFNFASDLSKTVTSNTANDVPTLNIIKNDILRQGVDLSAAVKLLNEFGTTRALSSPRLNAVNNQQAVLSFVENLKYFEVKITTTDAVKDSSGNITTAAKVDVTSTPKDESVGIILNLQPSINTDTQEVTMNVRPTIKRLVKMVPDPGFEVSKASAIAIVGATSAAGAALTSTRSDFPQIETRELDSIVKVKSGQTLVIGGLLEDKVINSDTGVPYASEVPLFGNLFKAVDKKNTKKELIIFIRATIVGSNGNADPYDKNLYEKFTQDPRPLKF
jgi:general secretion pathway protein D